MEAHKENMKSAIDTNSLMFEFGEKYVELTASYYKTKVQLANLNMEIDFENIGKYKKTVKPSNDKKKVRFSSIESSGEVRPSKRKLSGLTINDQCRQPTPSQPKRLGK